jgi:hypothetical protein
VNIYENLGCSLNDPIMNFTMDGIKNGYDISSWTVNGYSVITDIPSTSWTRAPG